MSGSTNESSPGDEVRSALGTSGTLLNGARADDPQAWNRLVALYSPLVYHWCRGWQLHAHDAADVVQEVFQSVAVSMRGFRKSQPNDTFRGWLRTITRNKVCDHFRRTGRQPIAAGGTDGERRLADFPAPLAADGTPPDDEPERELFFRALELIRSDFAQTSWQAFWRTTVDGLSAPEVAAELAMTPGAVRVAKSRVLQRLRSELRDFAIE
ncbi:MAG TPA: sigma-70 family RNA polymerase sigma factor [Pirellulales bacterium]|nr:sigma-70 family RNA polymerase sigma factor [Pirellulales bacterium]